MSYLRDLHTSYEDYVMAATAAKVSVLSWNEWLQSKIIDLERRIVRMEQAQAVGEGDGR